MKNSCLDNKKQSVDYIFTEEFDCGDLQKTLPELKNIALNNRQMCEFEGLSTGVFSPLESFMVRSDYDSVLADQRLSDGRIWPIPVCLDISDETAAELQSECVVELRDPEGVLLAVMAIDDIWEVDREKEALNVYGTLDRAHPGVHRLFHDTGTWYVGGRLKVVSLPMHYDFQEYRLTPHEVKSVQSKMGWTRVVGYQTRNPVHRIQYEMTLRAMDRADANLFLFTAAGITKPGDFDMYTRVRCLKKMKDHYPAGRFMLNLVPFSKRMAGPREALLHALIAKNYGCTHFVVGRDHAGPGPDSNGRPVYAVDEGRKTLEALSDEIDIKIIPFQEMVYLPFDDEYLSVDEVDEETQSLSFSGSEIRKRIKAGKKIPEWASFRDVVEEIKRAYPEPKEQGFTMFFTGLSGAGKSTLAKILYSRFLESGDRPVTLLDGDIVRRNLSSELNFSKKHRDINVRRIGFVASEITKNRGIAICAPIAPYASTRNEIRSQIEEYGGFFEIHVATPIEECEKRDRKGMYAKARAGLIKDFTGIDDPYEVPLNPELSIDTTDLAPDEAAGEIIALLKMRGYI